MGMAASLLEAGAEGPRLAEALLERMTMSQMKMIQRALARLTFSDDQRIGWLWVTGEDLSATGASNEDLEGLVNYPRNVEGVEVGLLFKQLAADSVKISLRSAGRVDVAAIAQQFGGGGHVRAAGCRIDAELPAAIERMVGSVRQALVEAG
jgi:phosphoesterase RecJ-like protein